MLQLDELVVTVQGWTNENELRELHRRAAGVSRQGPAEIVEIGSFHGRSTIALALACAAVGRGTVTAIDPYAKPAFFENIERFGVSNYVRRVISTSHVARQSFDGPIDLLFVDGSHNFEQVVQDFDDWPPLVRSGGTIAVDDPSWPGVYRALRSVLEVGSPYRHPLLVGNTLFLSVDRAGPWSATDAHELRRLRRVLALRRLVGSRWLHKHLPTRLSRWGARAFSALANRP